eukprot:CAMPEP_0185760628 /NCGR_PEP_ID=MMETSP1174-20130828/19536_1 /TAXON_ID=35687 /ORGANISM="Dictyocha speculum, Strain CCMP1381" /LENGTH=315 /DNA_ID=CAMNT_0028441531 /DNA_START=257 /DNA_END=1204 /DNA_ORIENTATION=+
MVYRACGLATSAAWTTVVLTAIRSNQPLGAIMPSSTHGLFARAGALSAVPIIWSCYSVLASASKDSWEELGSPTCRRLNLALVTSGVGSALWVAFAPILTRIPDSGPLIISKGAIQGAHVAFQGLQRASLIGAYGSAALLSGAVWAHTLPEDVRKKPWTWAGRVADGVAQSLVTLAPKFDCDPVNVKYSLLAASFGLFTVIGFGPFPMAVMPSWTGRRCSRAFPAWTLLAAVSSYNLKDARESGKRFADKTYHTLSSGLTAFGGTYLAARVGAVFVDPSWPGHYKVVTQVIGYQALAALMIGLTLRPDNAELHTN